MPNNLTFVDSTQSLEVLADNGIPILTYQTEEVNRLISTCVGARSLLPIDYISLEELPSEDAPLTHRLKINLQDGRKARYNFYSTDLQTYNLSIDGGQAWSEPEALTCVPIKKAFVALHAIFNCKITWTNLINLG